MILRKRNIQNLFRLFRIFAREQDPWKPRYIPCPPRWIFATSPVSFAWHWNLMWRQPLWKALHRSFLPSINSINSTERFSTD